MSHRLTWVESTYSSASGASECCLVLHSPRSSVCWTGVATNLASFSFPFCRVDTLLHCASLSKRNPNSFVVSGFYTAVTIQAILSMLLLCRTNVTTVVTDQWWWRFKKSAISSISKVFCSKSVVFICLNIPYHVANLYSVSLTMAIHYGMFFLLKCWKATFPINNLDLYTVSKRIGFRTTCSH